MDFDETSEYFAGYEWAGTHSNDIRELYTSSDVSAQELRSRLWKEAGAVYPSRPGNMENEYKQTLWVTGAMRFVVDKLPLTKEAMRAVWDMSLELGSILSAERWKFECWKELKAKPASWWKKKKGDASPDDVVAALAVAWRRQARKYKDKGREIPESKWEVLVDMTGSREMCVLAELENIELVQDTYWYYRVEGKESRFDMIMRPAYQGNILAHGTGEIVG